MEPQSVLYCCPDCFAPLAEELFCGCCGKSVGQCIDGIPCFADPDYYWGEIPEEEMRRVNGEAESKGWEVAIRAAIPNEVLLDYICSKSRADFQHLWNVPTTASVLDIGAGLGAVTSALASNFGSVTSVEGVLHRARFIRTRVRQANQWNVTVVCADFQRLPLAPAQFDVAVLNGVLEWSALTSRGNPREDQLRFLRRIREVLKPGGLACIGIENRVGWSALRGANDHSGMPYTNLLPRFAADLVCRIHHSRFRSKVNAGSYRTYTYSLGGYRRLFREAGFGDMQAFHAWDGYNDPTTLLPLADPAALVWFTAHYPDPLLASPARRRVLSLAARTGIWAQLASEFIFVVERP